MSSVLAGEGEFDFGGAGLAVFEGGRDGFGVTAAGGGFLIAAILAAISARFCAMRTSAEI